MYKVMIVDDEKYIRKSIKNRINWEKFHLKVTGEAGNGEEALKKMEEQKPDIVLVDIRMPQMDGLAFIAKAKKRYSEVSYIIMSAYSDFTYARKAMKLGVEDYILKPVEETELEEVLASIAHARLEEKLNRSICRQGSGIQDPFSGGTVAAVTFYTEEEDLEQKTEEAVRSYEEFQEKQIQVFYLRDFSCSNCLVFLLNGDKFDHVCMHRFIKAVWKQVPGLEQKAAFSDTMEYKKAAQAARQSVDLLKRKMFYTEETKILSRIHERSDSQEQKLELYNGLMKAYRWVLEGQYGRGEEELLYQMECIVRRESSIGIVERFIEGFLLVLRSLAEMNEVRTDFDISAHRLQSRDYLLLYPDQEKLKEDIRKLSRRCLGSAGQTQEREIIAQVREYIQNYYASDLNVSQIAQTFYLNASYLSAMFKEKTGMNLRAYIEGVRMERAKQYLRDENKNITEIAQETGYADSNYFSKVFKKYTGMTPRQFREAVSQAG